MKRTVLLNSASGTALYIVSIIVAFIMSPFLVHTLGNSNYGIWEVLLSIIGYMGIMDLGVGPALVRFVSVAHSKGDLDELGSVISSANLFFLVIGTIAAATLACLSAFPEIALKLSIDSRIYVTTVLLLFAVNVGVRFPLTVFTGTLMGLQCHYLLNFTRIALAIVSALAVYCILRHFPESALIALASVELVGNLVQMIIFGLVVYRNEEIPRLSFSNCSLKTMKELWTYGMKNMVMILATRLQVQSMPFVIGSILGLDKIVYFVMPRRLVEYSRGLSTTIGFPLTPYFASYYGRDDQSALRESWLKSSLALQIISNAMPVILFFCGVQFIRLWLGAEYADSGHWVLYFLLIGLAIESLAPSAGTILMAANRHGKISYILLLIAAVCVPLAIFSAKIWGLPGIAFASGAATACGSLACLWFACREMKLTIFQYMRHSTLPLVIPLVILAALLWASGAILPGKGYLKLIFQLVIGGSGYLIAIWALVLDREVRARIVQRVLTL